ncbi:MAG TPA: TonB-dependent receptor, partial [Gammaproteobacteria bacterium]|nr:TonB-dependent receptor [Gammaproteobacteria bacterium]
VSELLQAQLMQDININPVQPSVSATNLNIVTLGGPAAAGFNEFTPLFERNKTQFNASGFGGNNDTYGGEAAVSGVYDQFSYSLGAYSYNTDGWRPNNGLDQEVYNAFAQWAISPELNIQAEFRRRVSTEGDLAFNFDPDSYLDDKTVEREQDSTRVGLRYSPAPNTDFLFSYIYTKRDEKIEQFEILDPFTTLDINSKVNSKGSQIEAQNIYRTDRFNVITGLSYNQVDDENDDSLSLDDVDIGPIFVVDETTKTELKNPHGYVYVNVSTGDAVTWTLGASYDDFNSGPIDEKTFSPKFGVRWDVTNTVQLRAAALQVVKPALVNNRTIEPTQVAGFNQFFDDINATKSRLYGGALDWRVMSNLSTGAEATWRYLDEPVLLDENGVDFEERNEQRHRLYLYWTPLDQLSVSLEAVYDLFKSDKGVATEFDNLPEEVRTVSLPLSLRYFRPSGFFAGIAGTYVDQKVVRSEFSTQGQGSDNFFLVDAAIGYRLPKRYGILSLEVKNLFDKEFSYQDDSYREFRDEPAIGPYFPDRTILGQIAINF